MPNPCVFCGSTTSKINKEHVIPNWISKLFADEDSQGYGIIRDGKLETAFIAPLLQQTVGVVCELCNGGWMSKLEHDVMPNLGPMIQSGRTTKLPPQSQRLLATWSVKTAFMLQDFKSGRRLVPDSEYRRFCSIKQPPPGYDVFLARRIVKHDSAGRKILMASDVRRVERMDTILPRTDERVVEVVTGLQTGKYVAFTTVFTIGPVVFIVVGHNIPIVVRLGLSFDRLVGRAIRIWPIDDRGPVTWPLKRLWEIPR
jgi:hypothetical protein